MENETKSVNEEVKTQDADTKPAEEVKEETKEETKTEQKPAENVNDANVGNKTEQEVPENEIQENNAEVQEISSSSEGIRIEDLMTREEFLEKIAALEAKYDAAIKENKDLKDKYENQDFGNNNKNGMMSNDKSTGANFDSFDEYSKNFM